jgi:predicted O-methyltransferase YrrM
MRFEAVAEKVDGIPHMTRRQGQQIYDHIRTTKPISVLEIGTANAVGAAFMAAALEANGAGRVTSVDRTSATYEPGPEAVLASVSLAHRVELVTTPDSSYNWWLKKQVAARSDAAGNTEPAYDLVYLDGAHSWNIDGLAAVLIEKLLVPGGWLVLDDMDWTYATSPTLSANPPAELSDEELREPHIRAVFELILKPHPSFTEFRDDGTWGWAKKSPGAPRRLTVETETASRPLSLARMARGRLAELRRRRPRRSAR